MTIKDYFAAAPANKVNVTPGQDAIVERSALIADPAFRTRYMANDPAARAQVLQLNESIASGMPDDGEMEDVAVAATPAPDTFTPAGRISDYEFANDFARSRGLKVDLAGEAEVKQALHGAGVDPQLGGVLYHAAVIGASSNPMQTHQQHFDAVHTLQAEWGTSYAANVAAVQVEAVRLFNSLPKSIRGEESFEDFVDSRAIGSNPILLRALLARAKARNPQAEGA